jgi:hypothetical protein
VTSTTNVSADGIEPQTYLARKSLKVRGALHVFERSVSIVPFVLLSFETRAITEKLSVPRARLSHGRSSRSSVCVLSL